jgi:ketosteroid isomerase-like protein
LSWLKDNPTYRYQVVYKDIEVFHLADMISYAVAINEWTGEEEEDSARVTFIFRRYDDGEWRIVHLHRSAIPNK